MGDVCLLTTKMGLKIIFLLASLVSGIQAGLLITEDPTDACLFGNITVTNNLGFVLNNENCNAQVPQKEWQKAPRIRCPMAKKGKTYTLLMVDPDVQNYPKGHYYLHWLVTNIRGRDLSSGSIATGSVGKSYAGPTPASQSGVHRYMIFVLEEEQLKSPVRAPRSRAHFKLLEWLNFNKRKLTGPIAGMQFCINGKEDPTADYDD